MLKKITIRCLYYKIPSFSIANYSSECYVKTLSPVLTLSITQESKNLQMMCSSRTSLLLSLLLKLPP